MKSSTIRRSNLSKEKMAVLEALSKYNNNDDNINDVGVNSEPVENESPEVYVRQNKDKELDLLWKDFKIPRGERSPMIYLGIGFVAGIIVTLAVSAFIGMSAGDFGTQSAEKTDSTEISAPVDEQTQEDVTAETSTETDTEATTENTTQRRFGFFGPKTTTEQETATTVENKEYEVQSGDTMEKIVKEFYGSYSEEKVNAIMKANNMKDANKLGIGQKLVIPAN